ncbi:MAG: hypothetical protein P1U41_04200 [Vicingaceae bacterium]|nr:hypothetical protein [Vicingaceae bacterium]
MKNLVLIIALIIPSIFMAQSSRDVNLIIQKTIDLNDLKKFYSESEKNGETPLIIINDDKIPNNLIVFKFNKRVKIMTTKELETFKSIYKGNLDSYFVFEVLDLKNDQATIKATFRKNEKIAINISMKKEANNWTIIESSAS